MPTSIMHDAKTYRRLIFLTLAASYTMVTFHRLCPAVVAVDMMHDLDAGGWLLGMLSAAYFYSYGVMQPMAGLLADSWGARRTTTLFYALATAGSVCLGLATAPAMALVGRVLVGLGMSMLFVCTIKTLAVWYTPVQFSTMTGFMMGMGGVGSLLATAPLGWFAQAVGWRGAFLAVGATSAVLTLALWLTVRDTPAQAGFRDSDLPDVPAPGGYPLLAGVREVLANGWFWLLALWFFLDNAVFFSFAGLWSGPYLVHVHGYTRPEAGQILSLSAVGMVVGGPFMGFLSSRVLKGRKSALIAAAVVMSGLTALLAFRTREMGTAELFATLFLLAVSAGSAPAVAFTSVKELFPVRIAGTATGLLNVFPFAGGAVFQPLLGVLLERAGRSDSGAFTVQGYQAAFLALFVASLATLAVCVLLKETFPKK